MEPKWVGVWSCANIYKVSGPGHVGPDQVSSIKIITDGTGDGSTFVKITQSDVLIQMIKLS